LTAVYTRNEVVWESWHEGDVVVNKAKNVVEALASASIFNAVDSRSDK
jgi:hypothetical protein